MLSVTTFSPENEIELTNGTFWIDWSSNGEILSGPWTPYITIIGETTTGNALHLGYEGWAPWTEDGTLTAQGMPFLLYGEKIITNIEEVNNNIFVYPNPNFGIFQIETTNRCNIYITDIYGRIIYQQNNYQNETIDISDSKSGIYFIRINENDNNTIKKIIIQ